MLLGFAAAWMEQSNIILVALDALAVILTFIAGVVLAAKLGVHSCGNSVRILFRPELCWLSNEGAGLHDYKQPNQWLAQYGQAMP